MAIFLSCVLGVFLFLAVYFLGVIMYARMIVRRGSVLEQLLLSFPKRWKDLDANQFRYVATLLAYNNTPAEVRAKCFIYFSSLEVLEEKLSGVWLCKRGKTVVEIEENTILYFSKCFNFITDKMTEVEFLPEIRGMRPVNSQLRGVPLKLWMAAENYYQAFLYTQKEEYLRMLLAVIYCRQDYEDIVNFSDNDTIARANKLGKVDRAELYTCFIAYGGLKDTLSREFPFLFERSSVGSSLRNEPPKMREMFDQIVYALSEGGIANSSEVLIQEAWKSFYFLNKKARESKEMQERLKQIKARR